MTSPSLELAHSPIYDFAVKTLEGETTTLAKYRGRVILIVNVASQCGFTPQYAGLESLYRKYHERGFDVLAFPCNQFGAQEPGSASDIREFCTSKYDVTFPVFSKIDVNGKDAHPLYQWLKSQAKGVLGTEFIKWNFTKFLVNRDGGVVDRYGSNFTPEQLDEIIAATLSG